jgi:outer membrane protein assembly factor BamB
LSLIGALALVSAGSALAADWPTYLANNQRNAKSDERIEPRSLQLVWTWRSAFPPQPAWSGPAQWDAYAGIRNLKSMRNYDPVFHTIAVQDRLWVGSSADDHVYCLNATMGEEIWYLGTDGPVRIAPAYFDGRIYFGSDDGHAYCVRATDGMPIWRTAARPCDRMILNDGRFISQWPVRTGVTVENGIAYFGASLLPWQESYLCAVDAATGSREMPGCFVKRIDEATLEGPMAISPGQMLVVPQGRVAPLMFSIRDGVKRKSLEGGGGSFVVITPDSVFHGPGNKTGWLTRTSTSSQETIASLKHANAIIVANEIAYVLTDHSVSAANYVTGEKIWLTETDRPLAMILVGETLFAGGTDKVTAFDFNTGRVVWIHQVDGLAHGLAAANGFLFVSTDEGVIHGFRFDPITRQNGTPAATTPANDKPQRARTDDSSRRAPITRIDDPTILGHWVFQRPHVEAMKAKDLSGGLDASIDGQLDLVPAAEYEAIRLGGGNTDIHITRDLATDRLPQREFSVETWARVDESSAWGAFIGCFQDNGNFERGWLLGYHDSHPVFGLCTSRGSGRLTYLQAPTPYVRGMWFHLLGTYDGREMRLYVNGELAKSSTAENGPIHYPPQASYCIGSYRDDNEDRPLVGQVHEIVVYGRALSRDEVRKRYAMKSTVFARTATPMHPTFDAVAIGPYLRFIRPDAAEVVWQTGEPSPTVLHLSHAGTPLTTIREDAPRTDHRAEMPNLRRDRVYQYRIDHVTGGSTLTTREYECDTHFNFTVRRQPARDASHLDADERTSAFVQKLLDQSADRGGLCVVLGCGSGSLIHELAKSSNLRIIAFDQDADRADRVRYDLLHAGWYGGRVTVHQVDSLQRIPVTGRVANLVTSESILSGDETRVSFREAIRLLAPRGIALFGQFTASRSWLPDDGSFEITDDADSIWARFVAPELPGSGSWSHIYGSANNSHYGGESLARAEKADELAVQWIGRPGPRYQADRNGRKTPPLAAGGRIFLQGLDRLITLDQYNGTVLWSLEIPALRRFNMPRDCGNWCTDGASLFVALRDKCWQISAAGGEREAVYDLPSTTTPMDWGFVARHKQRLVGSGVRPGNIWLDFWGKEGWYDGTEGEVAAKVCSDVLFSLDVATRQPVWIYQNGLIVNSTISLSDDTIFFVEARNASLAAQNTRRLNDQDFWKDQYLVALDAASGQLRWQQRLEIEPGIVAFYASCTNERVVLVASNQLRYHIHTFAAQDGSLAWQQSIAWGKGKADHGSHLSRPAIVGQELYVRPGVFDLRTGKQSELLVPVGGCGTYAATDSALFFRAGSGEDSAMWNRQAGDYTMWRRLRPDCWLSTIPSGGMLLSPEGGGGCSCGKWMETSLGLIPKQHLRE